MFSWWLRKSEMVRRRTVKKQNPGFLARGLRWWRAQCAYAESPDPGWGSLIMLIIAGAMAENEDMRLRKETKFARMSTLISGKVLSGTQEIRNRINPASHRDIEGTEI
jgi:hypothetical protein